MLVLELFKKVKMKIPIYPLKFEPIYQYRLWGGRKLENLLSKPLPNKEPIGEAWILSDRKDHASEVSEGDLKNKTITSLMDDYRYEIMGKNARSYDRFPLLLKYLDCKEVFKVGFIDIPTILVCIDGKGSMNYNNQEYNINKGEVMLLPAIIGQLELLPNDEINLFQITIPDKNSN